MSEDARAVLDSQITERQFQAQVIRLARLCGWRVQFHWSERHSPAGWPDLALWRGSRFLLAELKTERGRVSAAQQRTIEELRECGLEVHLWRPSQWDMIVETLR